MAGLRDGSCDDGRNGVDLVIQEEDEEGEDKVGLEGGESTLRVRVGEGFGCEFFRASSDVERRRAVFLLARGGFLFCTGELFGGS